MVEHPGRSKSSPSSPAVQAAQLKPDSAASEQVRGAAPHLAGAGAAQPEAEAPVLHQPVDLVEQGGYLLHLVDDDLARRVRPRPPLSPGEEARG